MLSEVRHARTHLKASECTRKSCDDLTHIVI